MEFYNFNNFIDTFIYPIHPNTKHGSHKYGELGLVGIILAILGSYYYFKKKEFFNRKKRIGIHPNRSVRQATAWFTMAIIRYMAFPHKYFIHPTDICIFHKISTILTSFEVYIFKWIETHHPQRVRFFWTPTVIFVCQ